MEKVFSKMHKKSMVLLAMLLCFALAATLIPSTFLVANAAEAPFYPAFSSDPYSKQIVRYVLNDDCKGYYFTPKTAGKYRTLIVMHGSGGVGTLRNNLWSCINKWVKQGYFPPMNVVLPEVLLSYYPDKGSLQPENWHRFIPQTYPKRFNTLLKSIEEGTLSPQIGTDKPIYVSGFSMGGMAAIYAGDLYGGELKDGEFQNTRIKNVGALSPNSAYYLGDNQWGFRNLASDAYFARDNDALVYLSAGKAESSGQFVQTIDRYRTCIESTGNNKPGLVTYYEAPSKWGGHLWPLEEKEIFMYIYYNIYGEIPSESLVESATGGSCSAPTTVYTEETHTGYYVEPAGPVKPNQNIGPQEPVEINEDALIDLDMSTYVKNTSSANPGNVAGSIGGIVNSGTLNASTIVKMSSQSGRWTNLDLSKATFANAAGGTTSYLKRTITSPMCSDDNRFNTIYEKSLETKANTISFWAKYVPTNRASVAYNFLDYNVTYGDTASHLFTLEQKATTEGKFVLGGRSQNPSFGNITDVAANKWAHYVITNPEYVNGSKTMKVYVNGQLKGSKTVTKPEGTLSEAKIAFAGEANPTAAGYYWPTEFNLGDVRVYDGVLSAAEISAAYNDGKAKYTEAGSAPAQQNITGYTFSGSTVTYDGASHNIKVAAGTNATQGVNIAYTCSGATFNGATAVGTYNVTAKITKSGYNDLTLSATLKINPATIQGYTFSDSTVTYDGANHSIAVKAGSNATGGVTVTYSSNGAAFSGAKSVGTYPVTAKITKAGYNDLTLSATLKINPATIQGYTFSDSTVTYDGANHSIAVKAGSNATGGVTVTYSSNGAPFTGATEVGTYPITAKITKTGYNDVVLNAVLVIEAPQITPDPINEGDVLIDLDMSTYVKDDSSADPKDVDGSVGGIINNGTLSDSTVVKMSSQSGRWTNLDLSADTFENAEGGMTTYLKRTINTPICADNNRFNTIEEKALEQQANTISFWAKYVPTNRPSVEYNFIDYNVTYGDAASHLFTLDQQGTTEGKFTLVGRWQNQVFGNITDAAAGKWAHYVITNPAYVNGTKTMEVYVNGEFIGSKTVTKPEGALTSAKIAFAGEANPIAQGLYWPEEFNLGDVKVVAGVMSEDEIAAEYEFGKDRYTELGEHTYNYGDLLVDLDFSNLAATTEEGSSGIVNTGLSNTSVIDMFSSDLVTLSEDYIYNDENQEKKVMRITHNEPNGITAANAKQFTIKDPAFESNDITLSLWTNLNPIEGQTANKSFLSIAQYNAKRDDGTFKDGETDSRASVWQYNMDTQNPYYWGKAWSADFTVSRSKEWHHVVMTIPQFANGEKTVDIYVDGELKLTETVSLGGHALAESWIGLGSSEAGRYISGDISFGDVKIFAGALSADDISELYGREGVFYESIG